MTLTVQEDSEDLQKGQGGVKVTLPYVPEAHEIIEQKSSDTNNSEEIIEDIDME